MTEPDLIIETILEYIKQKRNDFEVDYIFDTIDPHIQIKGGFTRIKEKFLLFKTPFASNKRDIIISLSDPELFLKIDKMLNEFN